MPEYTGHKQTTMPDGTSLIDWLKPTIKDECNFYGDIPMPTDEQIAVVVRAMRMHHLVVHASDYDFSELHERDKATTFYPIQSSIGRFFRDAPLEILDKHRMEQYEKDNDSL